MKGKMLDLKEIVSLKNGVKVWIDYNNGHPYLSGLAIKIDDNLIMKANNSFSHKINAPTVNTMKVYEWIDSKDTTKTYYLDEILKMIREGNLKENTILISPSQSATGTIYMFGEISLNILKEFEPFEIYKEYMTFYEAKKLGTPKHKDDNVGYDYGEFSADDFVKEMDKKVWFIKG